MLRLTICDQLKKILFIVPYPFNEAPSQRFRFEQYFDFLKEKEYEYRFESFLNNKTWDILYKKRNVLPKFLGILQGFIKRFFLLFNLGQFDYVFIHREASPLGPPIFEWIICEIARKKVIFDFDDAIWLQNISKENSLVSAIKWHNKTALICKWSYKISCGNQFLADYALQFNNDVIVNPTTIDACRLHVPNRNKLNLPVIGWTGTHSTAKYLKMMIAILEELALKHKFIFKVISNESPEFRLPFLHYVRWSKELEIEELNSIDIGIMPLTDDDWSKGKCGFKALQYMALKIPALVSPVGVNFEIVDHGINGFHCKTKNEWIDNLKLLIENSERRIEMGKAGRKKVIETYSLTSNKENFLSLFS